MTWGSTGGWRDDSINKPRKHRNREGLLGGVPTLQETGLTGPLSIYKVVPKVSKQLIQVCKSRQGRFYYRNITQVRIRILLSIALDGLR